MEKPKCEAKTRAGHPCRKPAGWGTDHNGTGRCKLHGGKSPGGKPGNKSAVTTGAYETIHAAALTEEELGLYGQIDVTPRAQIEEEIRLLTIRERRMLMRIMELAMGVGADPVRVVKTVGWSIKGRIDLTEVHDEAAVERIQRIEQALTRVQVAKRQAIESLRRIEADAPPQDDPLEEFLSQMAVRREERRQEKG